MQSVLHVFYSALTGGMEVVAFIVAIGCVMLVTKVALWVYDKASNKLEGK